MKVQLDIFDGFVWLAYSPLVQHYLQARGIPELMLEAESETHLFGSGQVKARLETFVEMLEGLV